MAGKMIQAPGDRLAFGDVLEGDQKALPGHAATLHLHDLALPVLLYVDAVSFAGAAGQPRIGEEVALALAGRVVAEEFGEGLVAEDHALLAVQHAERLGHVVQGGGQLVLLLAEPAGHQADLVDIIVSSFSQCSCISRSASRTSRTSLGPRGTIGSTALPLASCLARPDTRPSETPTLRARTKPEAEEDRQDEPKSDQVTLGRALGRASRIGSGGFNIAA